MTQIGSFKSTKKAVQFAKWTDPNAFLEFTDQL